MNGKRASTYQGLVNKGLLALALSSMAASVACGGGMGSYSNSNPNIDGTVGGSGNSSVQLRISDAPSDRVIALAITVSAIKVRSSSGAEVDLLPGAGSVEVTHLAATNEPLAVVQVPQGEYTQMELAMAGSKVTYLDAADQPVEHQFSDGSTVIVDLNPPLTIGTESTVLNLDVDVANTVYLDLANNFVNVNPLVLRVSNQTVSASGEQHPEDGRVEHVFGSVQSVNGSSFTMVAGQSGQSLTFDTDESTAFQDASLATLTGGMVEVSGLSKADGSLLASEIHFLGSSTGAVVVEGLLTGHANSGHGLLVAQDGSGAGMNQGLLGSSVSLNSAGGTAYSVDTHEFDTEGLPFWFDESSFVPGQRVAVVGHDPLQPGPDGESAGLVDAASVELQQQTLNGTVSNYTVAETAGTASFDLLLPEDGSSYLSAANPGVTVIHVYQRSTTDVHNLTGGISDGQSVQVRGLLFYYNPATPASIGKPVASTTGASQQPFHLVASRIMDVVVPPM